MKRISREENLSDYELIVIPCNHLMEPISMRDNNIINRAGKENISKYIKDNYQVRNIQDGDIRIVPGFSIKPDIMFIKFPFRTSDNSIEVFKKTISNMFELERQNGYKRTRFPKIDPSNYGYTFSEIIEILRHRIKELRKEIEYLTKN